MKLEYGLFIAKNADRILEERHQKLIEEIERMESEEKVNPKMFELDISTIETIDDVKNILSGLDLVISEDSPKYESVKKYFKEVN